MGVATLDMRLHCTAALGYGRRGARRAPALACNYHGDLQLGKKVTRILFSLEPENVGYHLALSNIYNATRSWKEAGELGDIVHIKGLKKSDAYSLNDVASCTDAKKSDAYS
ncbi:hypothetical protein RND71_042642 [Anisodus tanguticus]|uniref:Uncharacterized protein n=1 Tax=Anisodus tanguticus TaxID=243964 RepID=A0AAE1UUV1_9SOLA|nr:hypothetical protein RND71_042642 [Anisodus tanguticus]